MKGRFFRRRKERVRKKERVGKEERVGKKERVRTFARKQRGDH